MSGFKLLFSVYNVVVLNYNGQEWADDTKQAFVDYVREGGGVVVVHAADNAFPRWPEYNQIIGLGGWGGRDAASGPYIRYRDDGIVRDTQEGRGGEHGPQHPFEIVGAIPSTRSWLACRGPGCTPRTNCTRNFEARH